VALRQENGTGFFKSDLFPFLLAKRISSAHEKDSQTSRLAADDFAHAPFARPAR
jgi:hypothetical protein